MKHRIHACLDGELPPEALSADERMELAALEASLAPLTRGLRTARTPDLAGSVMAALPVRVPLARRVRNWLWVPRRIELRLRPVSVFALAAALLLVAVPLVTGSGAATADPSLAEAQPEHTPTVVYVQFRLAAPEARHVAVAGSFTAWEPRHELYETAPGVWTAMVPLSPGVHDYVFVVDGEHWVPDPHAVQVDDSFGGTNSRIALAPVRA
jgi:hypothetical protein